jgi:atlastin
MGQADEPLTGFSWKAGSDRDTTGIIFWSDVFLHEKKNGEKLAIFIVDTQGLFDTETTAGDNSRIFSLSTLMSSFQVLNIQNHVEERDIEYLQVSFIRKTIQLDSQSFLVFTARN